MLLGILAAGAAVLLWRRLAGGLHGPLLWPVGLCTGLVLCGLTAGFRRSSRRGWSCIVTRRGWLADASVTALVAVAGASLTLGGTSPEGILALWVPVVIGETWGWSQRGQRELPGRVWLDPRHNLVQRFVRFRTDGGEDTVEGVVRCCLAPRQRSGCVHVAFCPPFAAPPRITVRQVSGPKARVRVGLGLAQGMRVDVRLADAPTALPQKVDILFTASR